MTTKSKRSSTRITIDGRTGADEPVPRSYDASTRPAYREKLNLASSSRALESLARGRACWLDFAVPGDIDGRPPKWESKPRF
jgi:hypothetical protein